MSTTYHVYRRDREYHVYRRDREASAEADAKSPTQEHGRENQSSGSGEKKEKMLVVLKYKKLVRSNKLKTRRDQENNPPLAKDTRDAIHLRFLNSYTGLSYHDNSY